jgi:hypothetical protein
MRESRLYGSVRGALGDRRPYRDPGMWGPGGQPPGLPGPGGQPLGLPGRA